jgi:hypothetical protein
MFETEIERRLAWEERKDELLEDCLRPPFVGNRPRAWWEYEAGRPEHLTPYPLEKEGSVEERADAVDEHHIEPLVFLASNGYLTDRELEAIKRDADEARPRIGTDAEHIGSGGVDRGDQRAVKLYEAVSDAAR